MIYKFIYIYIVGKQCVLLLGENKGGLLQNLLLQQPPYCMG